MGRVFHNGRKASVFFQGEKIGTVETEYDREHTYSPWNVCSYWFIPSDKTKPSILTLVTHTAAHAAQKIKGEILEAILTDPNR